MYYAKILIYIKDPNVNSLYTASQARLAESNLIYVNNVDNTLGFEGV